jgi:hypothetical protein
MKKLKDISVSVRIPIDYKVGGTRRLKDGKWVSLSEDGEFNNAYEEARSWIGDNLLRTPARQAKIETTGSFVCEHCGSGWTEDSHEYNGGCCDEDEKNNPELKQASKECLGAFDANR